MTKEEILTRALNNRCKYESSKEMDYDAHLAIMDAMEAYHESKLKEVTDADIEAYFKTWQNPRIKTADEQYEQWLNRYLEELIDSAIEGAKAMQNGEIKHIEP